MSLDTVGPPRLLVVRRSVVLLIVWSLVVGCTGPASPPTQAETGQTPIVQTIEVTRVVTATPQTQEPTPDTSTAVPESTTTALPSTRCGNAEIAFGSEIAVGAIVPLTRPGAARQGFAMQAAMNVAVEHVNATGGALSRPIRLIVADSAGTPGRAALAAERLIRDDCVVALVGAYHSSVAMAIQEIASQYAVPVIVTEAGDDQITASLSPQVFRIAPTASMLGQKDTVWMEQVGDFNGNGVISVAMLVENSTYGLSRLEFAERLMPEAGIQFDSFIVDLPTRDFTSIIARVLELDVVPDAVFIHIGGEAGLALAQQLLGVGIGPLKSTLIVVGPDALKETLFWSTVPDGDRLIVSYNGPWVPTVGEMGLAFAADYRVYFDRWPEPYAFASYDAVRLLATAFEQAGSLDSGQVVAALESIDIELASGRYSFPVNRNNPPDEANEPPYMWHQWPEPQTLFLQYGAPQQPAADIAVVWPERYRTTDGPYLTQ